MAETAQRQGLSGGSAALAGRHPDTDSLARNIERLTEASGGAVSCLMADPAMVAELALALDAGSAVAARYLQLLDIFVTGVAAVGSRRRGDRCLACDDGRFWRERRPTIIVVLSADVPGEALVSGICEPCARAAGWPGQPWKTALLARMEPALRRMWPGLRILPDVHPVAGSA